MNISPVVFRGEANGKHKVSGGFLSPYCFAESYDQAALYAGRDTLPIAAVLHGETILDLTNIDFSNPVHAKLVSDVTAEYDDWTCRYSGEPRDLWSYLQAGDLYDYESNGQGDRWRTLINLALDDFDLLRVLDCTDGTAGEATPIWVTTHASNICLATLGEQLAAMLSVRPWSEVYQWLERDHAALLERIDRLRIVDEDYRLDHLDRVLPINELQKIDLSSPHVAVWRALPKGGEICPGDWIALEQSYAARCVREQDNGSLKSLSRVSMSDVFWAGTDHNEFFFLPSAWRIQAASQEAYLKALRSDQVRILCDGERAPISRHHISIESLRSNVLAFHDPEACGEYHGPDHWARVSEHALAIARSVGVDPFLPYLFAIVHDSQREDDDLDPEHGPRAASFIRNNRKSIFGFLKAEDIETLAYACEYHSQGMTQAPLLVQACWDADRLDLWRVGIEPVAEYLCTPYAKQSSVINDARELLISSCSEASDRSDRQIWPSEAEQHA